MEKSLHPYIIFLPSGKKRKVLRAIFGSSVPVDILNFSIKQGISEKIYQKDLIKELGRSNKTIIDYLKELTELGILREDMEKVERDNRTVWLKFYQLSDLGRWFALLLIDEESLSEEEKIEIVNSLFKSYIRWIKKMYERLSLNNSALKDLFNEEIKKSPTINQTA